MENIDFGRKTVPHYVITAIVLSLLMLCSLTGCSPKPPMYQSLAEAQQHFKATDNKVLFLGIDALSWNVLEPLMAQGKLPHISACIKRGSSLTLRSEIPMLSPALWATIATGRNRKEHGITSFVKKTESGTRLVLSSERKVKALWNILTDFGLRVGMVGYFTTFPVEKVNGYTISDRYSLDPVRTLGDHASLEQMIYPPSLAREIHEKVKCTTDDMQKYAPQLFAILRDILNFKYPIDPQRPYFRFAQIMLENLRYEVLRLKICLHQLNTYEQPALFMFYMPGVDGIEHFFWKEYQKSLAHDAQGRQILTKSEASLGRLVPLYYEFADRIVGLLMGSVSPETNVLILSDHGFKGTRENRVSSFDFQKLLVTLGFAQYKPGTSDVDMEGSDFFFSGVLRDAVSIFLNSAKYGDSSEAEIDTILLSLQKSLSQCKTDKQRPLFRTVKITRHIKEDEYSYRMPDIIADIDTAAYGDTTLILPDGNSVTIRSLFHDEIKGYGTEDHDINGVMIVKGPVFRHRSSLIRIHATQYDVLPTIAAILHIPLSAQLEGRVLRSLFNPTFLGNWRPQYVRSYGPRDMVAVEHPGKKLKASSDELNKLKMLGYLE